jgi:hypothetical protein
MRRLVSEPNLCARMGNCSTLMIADWSYEHCITGVRAALQSLPRRQGLERRRS